MNSVETALLDNINNPNALFIFPTDISASQWADHVLRLMGPGTIAMNKFIAWDVFKQKSIKSKVQNKKSIPSALRKIFVSRLVKENADAARNNTPVFCSLILPEWAQQASQFTSWLTVILPQLGAWFNKTTGLSIDSILSAESEKAASEFKGDDLDLFVLARRYARFLETYSLFEPAWETPPFNNDGKNCFIFFPESLSDYNDYRDLLSESNHVKTISAPDAKKSDFDTFFYTNSRSEITEAALYIRALNEKHGILWDSIVVCIPDSKHYEPYVIREFVNRNIPFVKRTSKPLTDYPAGRFFRSILDCTNGDFSFSSLVSLIMNKNLPWKNTIQIEKLIQFGIKNNCLYSWTEDKDGKEQHINVWEDSFNSPVEFFDNDVRKFFMDLKKRALSLRCADSFAELRRQYFIFREHFFNMDECSEEANQVLSRCISELMNLTELEKSFPDVPAVDPFLFLTEYLSEVSYLPQAKSSGVAILPYKTAAAAPFDYHIVLGAGHENISVIFSRLNFLPGKKRDELGIYDEDASAAFINMHVFNSVKKSAFFCSEHTFSDYAIPHPKTNSPGEPVQRYADNHEFKDTFSADYYNTESSFSFSESISLHENQKKGFTEWKNRRGQTAALDNSENTSSFTAGDKINDIIKTRYTEKKKPRISASSLQTYFQCSLKWLFQRVFSLENLQIETSLMAENISGTVYHAVLNEFFDKLK
ncbi:MAG: PD-(D/E)XK nuclease family protein, partial [Treponema sp.]|nr:PD-(D/E)XK nuclease family protein [Treponema sp.]